MRTAVYAGSFDPPTNGHLWMIEQGLAMFDHLIVAIGDKVYVTMGISDPISCLDGATGKVIRVYEQTKGAEELIMRNGTIFAIVNKEPWVLNKDFAVKAQSDQQRVTTEFNWDGKPRNLLAIDAESGKTLWQQEDRIAPVTLAIDDKRLVYYNGDGIAARSVHNRGHGASHTQAAGFILAAGATRFSDDRNVFSHGSSLYKKCADRSVFVN